MHPSTFALIRHGQTDWNLAGRIQGRTEVPLNAAGIAQAHAIAEYLASPASAAFPAGSGSTAAPWADVRWDAVLTSPLGRARDTAAIIAARLGLAAPREHAGLIERNFGAAEGLAGPDLAAIRAGGEYQGAEHRAAVAVRAAAVLEGWHSAAGPGAGFPDVRTGSNAIVVSHGACLRLVLGHLLGRKMEPIDNATISLLRRDDSGWSLEVFNEGPSG